MTDRSQVGDERLLELQALFAEVDAAGIHFRNARVEFAIGMRETLAAVERAVRPGTVLGGYGSALLPLLATGRLALDGWLQGKGAESAAPPAAFWDALSAVRDLLSTRLMRLDPEHAASERQGLISVLGIIDQEMERRQASKDADEKSVNRVQWIEVQDA